MIASSSDAGSSDTDSSNKDPASDVSSPARIERKDQPYPFHAVDPDAALVQLQATREGISTEEAERRLHKFGPNVVPRGKRDGFFVLLGRQINNPLIWVLIASAGIATLVDWEGDGIKNGIVIFAVVLINSIIGFFQEHRAGNAIEALSQMVPRNVTVQRDGRQQTLDAEKLVPGDICTLAPGDHVPADLRMLRSKNVRIDESMLTGESVPVEKNAHLVSRDAPLGDRACMAFAGTLVSYGTGTGVVVATGMGTELSKISVLLRDVTDLATPLTRALSEIGRTITLGILAVTVLMLFIGVTRTMWETDSSLVAALQETIIFAIALAVGAIPEGLPAIVTIALAIGVQRMVRRHAIVRKLPAVETLGSTTVICTDKTGTLTRNEMTIRVVWTPGGSYELGGVGYEPRGDIHQEGHEVTDRESLTRVLHAAVLCSDATLHQQRGHWTITGDPTEGAIVVAEEKLGISVDRLRSECRRLDVLPFESENQWMATLHEIPGGGRQIFLKGGPEVVASRCSGIDSPRIAEVVHELAAQGMRVLAVAERRVDSAKQELTAEDVAGGLRFLGLLGMIDPPREEAIQAIQVCRGAGISVKMITGDHGATAAAIGRQLGILTDAGTRNGSELAGMSDADLRDTVGKVNVFARVAPEHKLRLVRALQDQNEIVAMTGDGVNDAPALKQANIGVAMGRVGTAASKQAADIVLADDNFASIGAAVEEGRRVYDNLIKSLAFVLPTNLGLALILMCAVAFFPFSSESGKLLLPLSPVQLLWINLVATVSLALPLAFEAPEPNIMRRPPRRPGEPVLGRFLVLRTLAVAVLMTIVSVTVFLWEYHVERTKGVGMGVALAESQTIAVTTIIIFQCCYLANCRSLRHSIFSVGLFSNPMFFVGVALVLILQAGFIYLPASHALFSSAPLNLEAWSKSLIMGILILPAITLEKWILRHSA